MQRGGLGRDGRRSQGGSVAREALIVSCAVSAGVHGALTPEHLREEPAAGTGFLVSTVLLAVVCVALALWPVSRAAVVAAGGVLAGLVVAYAFAVTTGIPVLHPGPEPADELGLATKAIELVGLAAALHLTADGRRAGRLTRLQPKGSR
ncbi:MAG: hypothetical protein M5U27_08925 [Gaiella sp.]|nr:hypothetical protein [Gaiella sp.]